MKVIEGILLLVACVLSVYAFPNTMPLALDDLSPSGESTVYNGELACSDTYSAQQASINQQISTQTAACLQSNRQSVDANSHQIEAQIAIVRANLTTLENNLKSCTAITDNLQFVTCVANDNNVNQHLLGSAKDIAENVENQLINSQQKEQSNQKNCINNVMNNGKQNLTNAANAYSNCLENIWNSV